MRRMNGLPQVPREPQQPANVWRYVDGGMVPMNLETEAAEANPMFMQLGTDSNAVDKFFENATQPQQR